MSLTNEQKANAIFIRDALNNVGIDSRLLQVAIISVCYKESGLVPRRENLNYSKERIMQCWPKTNPATAAAIEHNPEATGNYLYGGKYGNAQNEGFKYRGGGHNQITFKDIYADFGANPDTINEPKEAARVVSVFFKRVLAQGIKLGKFKQFGATTLLDIKAQDAAIRIAIQCNAGLGTSFTNGLVQEGYKHAVAISPTINLAI